MDIACKNIEEPPKSVFLNGVFKTKKWPAITNNIAQLRTKSSPIIRFWHDFCPPPKLFLHNCFILNSIFFQPIQLSIFVTNLFVYPSQLILRIKRSIGLVINIRNLSIKIQATIIIKAKNNKFINNI